MAVLSTMRVENPAICNPGFCYLVLFKKCYRSLVVKALGYKPKGRDIDVLWALMGSHVATARAAKGHIYLGKSRRARPLLLRAERRYGSNFKRAVEDAAKQLGVELGAKAAAKLVANEEANGIPMPLMLDGHQLAELKKATGIDVIPTAKVAATSDHLQLQAQRFMIRECFERVAKPATRRSKICYLGATAYELKYYKNPATHLYVHGSEGKDAGRIVVPMLEETLAMLGGLLDGVDSLPSEMASAKQKKLRVRIESTRQLIEAYEAGTGNAGASRICTTKEELPKVTTLVALDSQYNMGESEIFDYFHATGAVEMFSVGLYPLEMLFPDMPENPYYELERSGGAAWTMKQGAGLDWTAIGERIMRMVGQVCLELRTAPLAVVSVMRTLSNLLRAWAKTEEKELIELTGQLMAAELAEAVLAQGANSLVAKALRALYGAAMELLGERFTLYYKGGYSNSYEHSARSWGLLMSKVVLVDGRFGWHLETEMVQRCGAMAMFRLLRSSSSAPVVRMISLPPSQEFVEVLDLPASLPEGGKGPLVPKFISVNKEEFEDCVSFMLAQKAEALTIELVQTMVVRASSGIAIGSTEYKPKWTTKRKHFWAISIATFLEVVRRKDEAKQALATSKGPLFGERDANWSWLLKQIAKTMLVGAGVCLAGAPFLVYYLYKWLRATYSVVEIVRLPVNAVKQRWDGYSRAVHVERFAGDSLVGQETFDLYDATYDVATRAPQQACSCDFVQTAGDLGKQQIKCVHGPEQGVKVFEYEYSMNDINEVRAAVARQRDEATAELAVVLDEFIEALPKAPFKHSFALELLVGGPGVGKSHTVRSMIDKSDEVSNKKTVVYAPFSKLAPDYPAIADNGKKYTFRTTHKLLVKEKGVDTLYVDEYTAMEESIMLLSAYAAGVRRVVLVGDEKQTGIMPEEGQRFFAPGSRLRPQDARVHVLPVNFRNGQFAVAWCNKVRGSGMYANSDAVCMPEFKAFDKAVDAPGPVMTFTKDTAHEIGQAEGLENTVRKNQGSTVDFAGVAVRERDLVLLRNKSLLMVAITRNRAAGRLVFYVDAGPAKTELERELLLHDEEFLKGIGREARPDLKVLYGNGRVEDTSEEFGEWARKMLANGVVTLPGVDSEKLYDAAIKLAARSPSETIRAYMETPGATVVRACERCGRQSLTYAVERFVEHAVCLCGPCAKVARRAAEEDESLTLPEIQVNTKPAAFVPPDFSPDADTDYKWCTAEAALTPILETPGQLSVRQAKENVQAALDKRRAAVLRAEPVSVAVDPFVFRDYKDFVRAAAPGNGRGVAVPLFISFLKARGLEYIVEILADHDTRVVSEFWHSASPSMEEPTVFVTIVNGHASVMDWQTADSYLSEKTVKLTVLGKTREVSNIGYTTVAEIEERYPLWKAIGPMHVRSCTPWTKFAVMRGVGFGRAYEAGGVGYTGRVLSVRSNDVEELRAGDFSAVVQAEVPRMAGPTDYVVEYVSPEAEFPVAAIPQGATDAYALGSLVDMQVGATHRANHVGAALGMRHNPSSLKVNTGRLWLPMNKRGNLEDDEEPTKFAVSAGYGLWQTTSDQEALASLERYTDRRKTRVSVEGLRDAVRAAAYNRRLNYSSEVTIDPANEEAIHQGFVRDANARSYAKRVQAQYEACLPMAQTTYSTKAQFKPFKTSEKLEKVGQGISAVGPDIMLGYGSFMRRLVARLTRASNDNNIFDAGLSEEELKARLREQKAKLLNPTPVIADVVECDKWQNWYTHHALKSFLLGFCTAEESIFLERYFHDVVKDIDLLVPGLARSYNEGPKKSGEPLTLAGNTQTVEIHTADILKSRGRFCKVKKGDDVAYWGEGVYLDKARIKQKRQFTRFDVDYVFGEANFTGKTVTEAGLYDDVVKKARKALAFRAATASEFETYQISLRDSVKAIVRTGLETTLAASCEASHCSYAYALTCWNILVSLSHVSRDQWAGVARHNVIYRPGPNGTASMLPYGVRAPKVYANYREKEVEDALKRARLAANKKGRSVSVTKRRNVQRRAAAKRG